MPFWRVFLQTLQGVDATGANREKFKVLCLKVNKKYTYIEFFVLISIGLYEEKIK